MIMMYRKSDQIDEVKLTREFRASEVEQVQKEFFYLVERGSSQLIIDMSELKTIDKEALELLLACERKAKSQKGWLAFVCPTKNVVASMRLNFPSRFFSIFFSKKKALLAMGA